MSALDTKRENADEKVRIKTLSFGVIIPDITFELAKNNEKMYLFSPYDIERVYGKPFSEISITKLYRELVDNPEIRKTKISARQFFQTLAELQFESGYPYVMFEDTVNNANPIEGKVKMSNLCVAPETLLLTDEGEVPIITKVDQEVNIWNGEEWSTTTVKKTGTDQKLLTVKVSNGRELDCTEYHKWYKQEGYGRQSTIIEVRTIDLEVGDKLIKWDAPIIEGTEDFPKPYLHGFISGDGTMIREDKARVYLYNPKMGLFDKFELALEWRTRDNRMEAETIVDVPKFTVPTVKHTIKSRLTWLSGWLDADGSVYKNGTNEALVGASINETFLKDVQSMLLTLGIQSKISLLRKAGTSYLPLNNGTDDYGYFDTKDCFRLLITSNDSQKLLDLGLKLNRLKIQKRDVQRDAKQFVVVTDIVDTGRISDTYCVTEPKRHMAVFNGILTGNCTEILQVQEPSEFNEDGTYKTVGKDISCNLGSLNIAKAMESPDFGLTVERSIRALTSVSDQSDLNCVPSIERGNKLSHAVGLGQMNLHGFLAKESIHYGDEDSLEFVDLYMMTVTYHAIRTSNLIAMERNEVFYNYEKSKYATGEYFDKYITGDWLPKSDKVKELFNKFNFTLPTNEDWEELKQSVMKHGLYNQNLQAIAPTGSISYINNSTSSVHPITSKIEIRKEGKVGRVYYPAPHMTQENLEYYKDAYEIGYEKLIDVYSVITKHVDQGSSLTLFFRDSATTRDVNKAQIYAWRKGIKTIYYVRIKQKSLEGTEVEDCVACSI
jgi:ribonucleoside-diphosphate reductase alpha chain